MQIKCPECGFSREVNESQIPAGSSFATCPKCGTRFRFRPDQEEAPAQDDALPEESPPAEAAPQKPAEKPADKPDEPKEGDIWASMDKMRREWDEMDREETSERHYSPEEEARRLREEAGRAYRQAAQAGRIPFLSGVGSVPWEYRGGFLNPLAFIRTILLMLTRSPAFFAGINPLSSIVPAWVFYILCFAVPVTAAVTGVSFVVTGPDGGQQIIPMYEMFSVPVLVFTYVCMFTLLLFLGSFVISYTIQLHSGPRASFRLTFKALAYAHAPIMLAALPGFLGTLGLIGLLSMLFLAIRYAYGFSWRKTVISVTPFLLLLMFLGFMLILQAASGQAV